MATQKGGKLNQLERLLPEGLIVDAAWLERQGYSRALRHQYVSSGWLVQPARGVYRRHRTISSWEQIVISLQTLLQYPVSVGGRSALELQGYAHYLPTSPDVRKIHLYTEKKLPGWLTKFSANAEFISHNRSRFLSPVEQDEGALVLESSRIDTEAVPLPGGLLIMEGLANLRPRRLQALLEDAKSIKVKRLFFFFADRHRHKWLSHLDRNQISLGSGKRVIFQGGILDSKYRITVPEESNAVH